jgi:predicted DNA binding CopG/RHH family protein
MYYEEIDKDKDGEEEIDEITTTGDAAGYETPYAFKDTGNSGEHKKKKKRIKEELSQGDLHAVKNIIRSEVAAILRDIWIKRASWVK